MLTIQNRQAKEGQEHLTQREHPHRRHHEGAFHGSTVRPKKVKNISHSGNIPIDAITRERSMAREFKEVLGTAQSVGCTVEEQNRHDIIDQINDGDIEILEE
ncbi:large ribosomal subunit protein uL11-like [Lytechinus pictus]|uniref:large ribosomal subunit protein uL11-like n=1 Tax=Lytechinus pictus TaxID=7653 RepID=UPI0030B9F4D0